LEDLMAATEWKSDFIESYVNVGIEQGREEGLASGKAGAIVKVLDVRQLQPATEQLAQVSACTDLAQLDRWFERSLTAATAAEVFRD
jgi:hypothetical protein